MRSRRISGLQEYGLTLGDLRRLGDRPVRVDVSLPVSPDIYPSARRLRRLLALSPQERRSQVRAWRTAEYERLCRELPFEKFTMRRSNHAPVGISAVVPARVVGKLRELRHADGISVREIPGLRRRVRTQEGPRLYAVRGRLAFSIEGQSRGLQRLEERVVVVTAESSTKAAAKARRFMAHSPYLSTIFSAGCSTRS